MVRLPDKLSTLGYGAFSGCANLTDVAFNDVLLRIEGAAFSNCTSLLDADLPDSVELMERNVFSGCTALRTGHYPLNLNQVGFDGLFSGCKNLTSFTIQEGVENLCGYFFKGANYLKRINLPDSLICIQESCFEDCTSLTTIVFGNSLSKILSNAFRGCTALRELDLPYSLTTLGDRAFNGCSALRRIYIPSGVVSIGRDCFTNAHRSFEIWTEYGATAVQYAIDNSHAYYYLSLTDWHVPGGTLYLGYDFNMYGYVRSTVKVTSVTAAIANASGEVVREASATPNVNDYSIGGGFAEQLSIETLPLGNYTFTLGAATSKSSETFVSRGFKVQEAPLIVNLSRYSLRSTSMDKGDDRPVTGLLSANYPITRVTFRVAPDEGNAIDNSAAPGTDSYQLSGLGVNLSALEAGDYTVSILVQGHGETVETGKVSIGVNGLTLASGSQIDEGAFDAFIRDRANKEYWLNNFPGIRTYETQAMNVLGYDVYVANGIFFSNAEDYANAYFRDLFSGQNQGFNSPTFYKEMAKEEIKSLINDLGTEGFAEYSYNKTFAEKVAAMFNKGDKLVASMLFDDVDKMTPYEAQYITEWNTIAENLGDMYKIVSNCEDLSEIIVNCTVDFSQGMAVLDAVENDCDYTGEYSRYYQNAVDELRLEFGNYIYNALSRVLNFAAKKVMEEGLSNLTKNVLGAYAKSYSLAKLFYKALDMVGDYEVGKDYVDYLMKMLSYTNAEKNFEEAFQAIVDGDTSDAAKIRLACRFDTVRRCAYRALEKLTSIGYGYDKGIDMQGAFNLYKELYYHTTCPFVVSQ